MNAIANVSLLTGPVHAVFAGVIATGCASLNAPLASVTVDALSAASPAVEVTVAVVDAVYSLRHARRERRRTTPERPSDSDSVAGTVPPTGAVTACGSAGP